MPFRTKILLVEHDSSIAEAVTKILLKLSYTQVTCVTSGAEAVNFCKSENLDIVIIDYDLKGELDSIETASLINLKAKIPLIYITSSYNNSFISRVKPTRPYGFIIKPVKESDLDVVLKITTLRIDSEKKIRESEERYLRLTENAKDMIYRMSIENGIYEYVNRAGKEITGYSMEDFYNKPFLLKEIIHPTWLERWNDHFQKLRSGETEASLEFKIIDKSGNEKWLSAKDVLIKDKTGKPIAVEGIISDVTARRATEEALKESEYKYRNLIQNAPMAMTRLDIRSNKYEFSNDEFEKRFGMTIEEINSMTDEELEKFYHPEDVLKIRTSYNTWAKGGFNGVNNFSYRMYDKKGQLHWFDSYHYADFDKEGKPYAVNQIYLDVTDKMFSDVLLRESEQKFRALAESMPAQLVIYQNDYFVYVNPYSEILTGYTTDELLQKRYWDMVHQDMQQIVKERGKARLRGEEVPDNYELKIITKSGEEKWLHAFAKLIEYNNQPAVLVVAFDITDKKETESKLKQSEERYKSFITQSSEGIYRVELEKPVDVNLPPEEQTKLIFEYARIAECNDVMAEMYGFKKKEELVGKYVKEMLVPDEFNFEYIKKFVENSYRIVNEESHEIDSNGNPLVFSNNAIGIVENGYLVRIWGTQLDITEKKKVEEKLRENIEYEKILNYFTTSMLKQNTVDEILSDIVNTCFSQLSFEDCVIYLIDEEGKYLIQKVAYGTKTIAEKEIYGRIKVPLGSGIVGMVGLTGQPILCNDTTQSDLYIPEEEVNMSELAVPILSEGKVIGVIDSENSKKNFFTDFHLNMLKTIASICSNKIVQALAQEKIIQSEERYRTFVEQSSEGIFRFEFKTPVDTSADLETQVTLINKNVYIAECNHVFARMYGAADPALIIGKKPEDLKYVNVSPEERTLQFILNGYKFYEKESVESDSKGEVLYFSVNATGIIENGKLVRIWGVQRDITEKKKSEESLKRSLQEKEILLKEIHHRVKNNLQIVASLLKLQASYVRDENVKQLFRESQNRVHSMSLIHQKLYQTKNISRIKFKDYLENVITHLQHSFGILQDRVKIQINVNDIVMPIDNAIPCGLIINELVSNSFKYAFPNERKGNIFINAAYDDINDRYWLTVRDDGIGLTEEVNLKESTTFGLQLVSTLVSQMDGSIEVFSKNGTEYRITFRSAEYLDRSALN
ncbi:MAG: PAS domain S-box protein [Ignavibacteria bacterium]|nr:PAS domain S-box protein [Ignavibacteria bacterium]